MRPRDATTERKQMKLRRDNKCTETGWILVDASRGTVTLCKQGVGENSDGMVAMPRRTFNALIDWYNREQVPPKKRRV